MNKDGGLLYSQHCSCIHSSLFHLLKQLSLSLCDSYNYISRGKYFPAEFTLHYSLMRGMAGGKSLSVFTYVRSLMRNCSINAQAQFSELGSLSFKTRDNICNLAFWDVNRR